MTAHEFLCKVKLAALKLVHDFKVFKPPKKLGKRCADLRSVASYIDKPLADSWFEPAIRTAHDRNEPFSAIAREHAGARPSRQAQRKSAKPATFVEVYGSQVAQCDRHIA